MKYSNSEKNKLISLVALILFVAAVIIIPASAVINYTDSIYTSSEAAEYPTIIIDAGHGGEDSGTIGVNGRYEKDLNMEISEKLGQYLTASGFKVVYTRTEDCLLYTEEENIKGFRKINDLKNRVKIANEYENALFVSIHMNSYGSQECKGLQVYYSDRADSRSLAQSIQSQTKEKLQVNNNRAIKEGKGIYVLENCTIPAVLVECGFLSNPQECEKLSEKEYQKELCFAILCGIIEYTK